MHILDAPCGYGRHACFFAKKGIYVTGIDCLVFLLSEAEKKCKNLSHHITFKQGDLRSFQDKKDYYDAVVSFFSSFGYFSDQENEKVLKQYYGVLKSGGGLLLDMPNLPYLAKRTPIKKWFTTSHGRVCDEMIFNKGKKIAQTKLTFVKKDYKKEVTGKIRLYSFSEIKKILINTGFKNIFALGSFSSDPYSSSSSRMIIIATKK